MKKFLKTTALAAVLAASFANSALAQINVTPMKGVHTVQTTNQWDKTFKLDNSVAHQKVQFRNRYGITVVGDLYMPKNAQGKLPAIVLSGPTLPAPKSSPKISARQWTI